MFLSFVKQFNFKHPALIGQKSMANFFEISRFSESTQNNYINSLRFFYTHALKRRLNPLIIVRPKKKYLLPKVLSKQEVKSILENIENIKHKAIIALLYSGGLRRSELINMKITDIQSDRKVILIRNAKGKKDRQTMLSDYTLGILREYYKKYKPKNHLFEGEHGKPYSATSMAKILQRAAKKAGIRRSVHLHMLRHSFATHLIDDGIDIRYVQELLGHNSIKTTERYTHITVRDLEKIKNPIDKLMDSLNDNRAGP